MHGPTDMPGGHLIWIQTALLWLAFGIAAVAGGAIARRWWRAPRPPLAWPRAAALAGLGLLALGLRLFVSPHTVLTENAHGYELLRAAFTLEGYPFHGSGYYAFFYLVTAVFGRQPEVVFAANAVLGAASALLLVPLGARVAGHPAGGWLAAVAYACWPAALRIGAAETAFPLGLCCALLAWLAWLRAWDTGERVRFVLAAALVAVTVQVRPELAPWPVVLLLSLTLCPGWTARLRGRGPLLGFVTFALLAWAWVWFRVDVQTARGVPEYVHLEPRSFFLALTSRNDLFLRPDWTPAAAWALGVLGVLHLALARWRALPALLLGVVVMGWMVMAVIVADVTTLRLQSPTQLLALLAVGAGGAAVAERLGGRAGVAAVWLLGGVLAVASALRFPLVREPFDPQGEFVFLERTVRTLPDRCAVLTAPRSMARNRIITEYPVWWARGPVDSVDRYLRDPRVLDGYPCRYFYLGLSCYQFAWDEPETSDGVRPECRGIERVSRLVPGPATTFARRSYAGIRTPAPTITLGFYRLEPRPSASAPAP